MAYSGWVVSIGPNYASGHCLRIVLERIVVAASSMVFCIHISFSTSQISNTTFMTLMLPNHWYMDLHGPPKESKFRRRHG